MLDQRTLTGDNGYRIPLGNDDVKVTVVGRAKEGLIKQRGGEKARQEDRRLIAGPACRLMTAAEQNRGQTVLKTPGMRAPARPGLSTAESQADAEDAPAHGPEFLSKRRFWPLAVLTGLLLALSALPTPADEESPQRLTREQLLKDRRKAAHSSRRMIFNNDGDDVIHPSQGPHALSPAGPADGAARGKPGRQHLLQQFPVLRRCPARQPGDAALPLDGIHLQGQRASAAPAAVDRSDPRDGRLRR